MFVWVCVCSFACFMCMCVFGWSCHLIRIFSTKKNPSKSFFFRDWYLLWKQRSIFVSDCFFWKIQKVKTKWYVLLNLRARQHGQFLPIHNNEWSVSQCAVVCLYVCVFVWGLSIKLSPWFVIIFVFLLRRTSVVIKRVFGFDCGRFVKTKQK